MNPSVASDAASYGASGSAAAQTRLGHEVERLAHQAGVWSIDSQARSRATWMTVARSATSAARRAGSNSASRSTRTPRAPHARAIAAKSTGPRSRRDTDPGPPPLLPHPDRPVALVVEDDDDDPGADPDGRLDLGHRHPEAAVADERDDRPIAMDQRGRDRRGQAVAHRARGRAEERARTPEPEAAAGPAREVARVGGQDRVVGQDPAERRDRPAGMDARAVPRRARRRPRPPRRPPGPRGCSPGGWRPARRRGRPCRAAARWRP